MKKRIAVIVTFVLIASLLCSCGSNYKSADTAAYAPEEAVYDYAEPEYYDDGEYYEAPAEDAAADSASGGVLQALTKNTDLSEKIIYTATAYIETIEFDTAIEKIYALIDQYGGFVEASYVSGNGYNATYYGYQSYRNASFTIRVPKENYAGMTAALDTVGNVTGTSVTAQNITAQFTDAQARLDTYEAEEQRLLEMMEKAETVEDLIAVEARLSEVRYQIEAITSTLRNWQNSVDYSTVNIELQEVKELTDVQEVPKTFGQEVTEGFKLTLTRIGRFFRNFAAWLIINLPTIVIIAAVVCFLIFVVFRNRKNRVAVRRARREERALLRINKNNVTEHDDK